MGRLRTNPLKGLLRKFEEGAGFDTHSGDQAWPPAITRGVADHRTGPDKADQNLAIAGRCAIGMEQARNDHRQARSIVAFGLGPFADVKPDQTPSAHQSVNQVVRIALQPGRMPKRFEYQ